MYVYRVTSESLSLVTWHELFEKYDGDFYAHKTFFKINNSLYIQSLSEQLCNISHLTHFVTIDSDCKVDIIASCEPKIFLVNDVQL